MAKKSEVSLVKYDSNPFTLAFNSFIKFFNTNTAWAVVLLVLGFISFVYQMFVNLLQLATNSDGSRPVVNSGYGTESISTHSSNTSLTGGEITAIIMIVIGVILLVLIMVAVVSAVATFINGVFSYVAIKSEEGKSVGFEEALKETASRFWRLYLAQILAVIKIFGWSLLLIIPGVVAAFRYALLPFVIMGEPASAKGVRSAHTNTKSIVKGRLMEVFGIATVAAIVPIVGSIMQLTGNASLYKQLKAYSESGKEKPKIHWLNYLGFMILGLVLVILLFVVMILALTYVASNA